MELHILGCEMAMAFVPSKRTYAIRIDSAVVPFGSLRLRDSGLYTIVEYVFDDIDPGERGKGKLFDKAISQELLTDFSNRGLEHDVLLVHCMRGKNRSPAVGMALNDIFGLGYDAQALREQFPDYTRHVYHLLTETAQRMGISHQQEVTPPNINQINKH